jgi:hypothetical protein
MICVHPRSSAVCLFSRSFASIRGCGYLDKGVRAGEICQIDQTITFIGSAGGSGELAEIFFAPAP